MWKPKDSLEPRKIPSFSTRALYLSKAKLEKIKYNAMSKEEREAIENAEKQKDLEARMKSQEESKKIVDAWPDSYAGILRAEKNAAKLLEEEIHAQCLHKEAQEANYQKMRLEYITELNARRLYEQTDRVKGLLSLKNEAEALKGNNELRQMSGNRDNLFGDYEREVLRNMLDDEDNFHEEDRERKLEIRQINKNYAAELDKQREYHKKKLENERTEEFRTTTFLHDLEDENIKKDAHKAKLQKDCRFRLAEEHKESVARGKILAAVQLKLEEAEEERNRLFQEAKYKMKEIAAGKQRENKLEEEKRLEAATKALTETRGDFKGIEEKREELAVKAMLRKQKEDEKLEKEKQAKKKKTFEEINRYRIESIENKERKIQDEKSQQVREHVKMKEDYDDYMEEKIEKLKQNIKKAKDYKHNLMHQIAKKKLEKIDKQRETVEEGEQEIANLRQSEDTFQVYAKELLEDFEEAGLDTRDLKKACKPGIGGGTGPLLEERGGLRPVYLAANIPVQLSHVPRKGKILDTKSRLGFDTYY